MAFRVVLIENEVEIKVKLNNLIVTKEGNDIWIPLDDISIIVMYYQSLYNKLIFHFSSKIKKVLA